MIQPISQDDILLWPDGSWCYRSELSEHSHKSDDYETFAFGSHAYLIFFEDLDAKDKA